MRTHAMVRSRTLFSILVCFVMVLACTATRVPSTPTSIPPTSTPMPPTPTPIPPTSTPMPPTPTLLVQCAVTATKGLNLRSGPDTAYPILTTLVQGLVLIPIARSQESDWVKVRTRRGVEGWVLATFIKCDAAIDSLPTARPVGPPPVPTPPEIVVPATPEPPPLPTPTPPGIRVPPPPPPIPTLVSTPTPVPPTPTPIPPTLVPTPTPVLPTATPIPPTPDQPIPVETPPTLPTPPPPALSISPRTLAKASQMGGPDATVSGLVAKGPSLQRERGASTRIATQSSNNLSPPQQIDHSTYQADRQRHSPR